MQPGRRDALILAAAGLAAAAAGFLVGPVLLETLSGKPEGEGAVPGELRLPPVRLLDLAGQPRSLSEWRGRFLVCNFWATWCEPCREEIPLLIATWQKYLPKGLEIVGIAIDNGPKVAEFSSKFKIPYPVLLAQVEGLDLMRQLGNKTGGLPYTVFADRQGNVVHRKLGALRTPELGKILDTLVGA